MWGHNLISSAKHVDIKSDNDDIKDCKWRGTDSCNPLHLSITGTRNIFFGFVFVFIFFFR